MLEGRVRPEDVTLRREPAPIQHHELARDVAHGLAHARPRLVPVGATHLGELRFLAARVLADQTDVLGVDVDAIAALELDDEPVAGDAEHLLGLHAVVPTDTVHAVNDEVADRETFVVIDSLAGAARVAVNAPPPGEVGLGHERDLLCGEHRAAIERGDHDVDARRLEHGAAVGDVGDAVDRDAFVDEDLLDAVRAAGALGRDEHPVSVALRVR